MKLVKRGTTLKHSEKKLCHLEKTIPDEKIKILDDEVEVSF